MSAVIEEMTAPWNETILPTLLSNYKLENVFNANEFGLLYQCLKQSALEGKIAKLT